jgi:osmoprotectant transport system permease protein
MIDLLADVRTHLLLAGIALAVAAAIGLPLGIAAAYGGAARGPLIAISAILRTLPSLAVLAFMVPLLGVGFAPAVVALTLLAIAPIAINADIGLRGVPTEAIDAARGVGMSGLQIFVRVAWPQARPQVLAGIRTAAIEVIASATLATFIGAGGLGDLIVRGLQTDDAHALYLGAATVAILALLVDGIGALASRRSEARG